VRTVKKLVLEKAVLIQLLGDEAFYKACPVFLWLKDTGMAAVAQYNAQIQEKTCGGCGGPSVIDGVVDGFVRNIKQHYDNDPTVMECMKDFIGSRRGKRPKQLEVRYKSGATARSVVF